MVTEFFQAARPAADVRAAVAEQARRAFPAFLRALAVHGISGLRPMGWPARAIAGLLLDAAPCELTLRRLGDALALTSRQVNPLEQRLLPQVRAQIAFTRHALEEREREEHLRLRRLLRGRFQWRIGQRGP